MIDLYKANGQLKARAKLLYDFREVKVNEAKEAWLEEQRVAYELAYPVEREMTIAEYKESTGESITKTKYKAMTDKPLVDNEAYITFEEYLAEEVVTQEAVEATETTEAVMEVKVLAREFKAPEIAESELDSYLITNVSYTKNTKESTLATLTVDHNTVIYDANGKAIGNMAAAVSVANFKYNQAIAQGMSVADAYQAVYKDVLINWKGADNLPHEVQVESIAEALYKGMNAVATAIGV